MDYRISGSNLIVRASELPVEKFQMIYSDGTSNTIYLSPGVGASPGKGSNFIYGVNDYNVLQYFNSPKGIRVDIPTGKIQNGYGGIDTFTGINVFQGSMFADYFQGSSKDEIYYTARGADTVIGGGGYDRVTYYTSKSSDYEIVFDKIANSFTVKEKNSDDLEKDVYFDIDEIEFADKSIINPNNLGFASSAKIVGTWEPIDRSVYTSTYHPTILPSWRPVKIGVNSLEGFAAFGWAYSGFDNKATSVTQVNSLLIEQLSNGNFSIVNDKYLSSSVTNGGNSVVVADFNGDKQQDIVLMAHNESPFVSSSSTAYLSNVYGKFDVVKIPDLVMAHDAELAHNDAINAFPTIVIKSFGQTDNQYQFVNGEFKVVNQAVSKSVGGMSIALADLNGDGSLEAVVGDVMLGQNAPNGQDKFYIGIYSYGADDLKSSVPQKILVPYFTARSEFSQIYSEWGKGVTHVYRLWIDDFNQDGNPDIIAGTSMWKQDPGGAFLYPSKLQMFQNQGGLVFDDRTDSLNKAFSTNVGEVDYNLQARDIDGSGISTYISSSPLWEGPERQQNFILLNDGTGNLYVYKHAEFNSYYADAQVFAKQEGYGRIGSGQFHAYLNSENKISLLLDADISGEFSSTRLIIQMPLNLYPTEDFTQAIKVLDRNQSKNIRTWAGNDSFSDVNSNALLTHIDGGLGIDTAFYSGMKKDYLINSVGGSGFQIKQSSTNLNVPKVNDTLNNIERIKFKDEFVALDINKNAGITAKILGAVFGKESLSNKNYVGIGLNFLDAGWTYDNLAGLALDAVGAKSHDQIVSLLWKNVIGTTATSNDKAPYIAMLENGMTPGALAHLAADTAFNTTNINLTGLALTGIEYLPVA